MSVRLFAFCNVHTPSVTACWPIWLARQRRRQGDGPGECFAGATFSKVPTAGSQPCSFRTAGRKKIGEGRRDILCSLAPKPAWSLRCLSLRCGVKLVEVIKAERLTRGGKKETQQV